MDTANPQKFPFILDRNLAKANCTEGRVCTSCDKVVLDRYQFSDGNTKCLRLEIFHQRCSANKLGAASHDAPLIFE